MRRREHLQEISPGMLVDSGVSYVILGHSERRQYFNEDDECINRKVRKAIEYGLIPIICCGETIQQREENNIRVHKEADKCGICTGIARGCS